MPNNYATMNRHAIMTPGQYNQSLLGNRGGRPRTMKAHQTRSGWRYFDVGTEEGRRALGSAKRNYAEDRQTGNEEQRTLLAPLIERNKAARNEARMAGHGLTYSKSLLGVS